MSSLRVLMKQLAVTLAGQVLRSTQVRQDFVPIFMLHRVGHPPGCGQGHDPGLVRSALQYLRRERYAILGLDELVERLQSGELPERAVAFTLDDGYADQARIGAELFLALDCPVTIFLTTGFVDGSTWPVDARVAWLLQQATRPVQLPTAAGPMRLDPSDELGRHRLRRRLVEELKAVPMAGALSRTAEWAEALGVRMPESAPPEHAPMGWDEARRLEARGVRFGAHSVNHALLAREDEATARKEIAGSLARLGAELAQPSRVFCYPNGLATDYGERERALLAAHGCIAAVSAEPGYARPEIARAHPYDLPRFGFPDNLTDFRDIVLQLQRLREQLRSRLPGRNRRASRSIPA